MHHNRKQGRLGDAPRSFRSSPAALLLQYILLSCARLPTYCFRKPSVSAIHPRNLFAHNLHPAARIMRTTAQCMIVFHKEFAHTSLCLFHRAAAVSAHHILIHMCCGERRGTRLNRGDIVLPQKFRNRSPICPWRDRNLAQVRQLPYIFPARVIRLTAPVAGKRKALQYRLWRGKMKSRYISGLTCAVSWLSQNPHISPVITCRPSTGAICRVNPKPPLPV